MSGQRVILTCAVTGGLTRPEMNPNLPVSPQQIAESCLQAADAGAAIVHIHVRHPDGRQSMDVEHYRDVVQRIRAKNTALIINLTTGPGGRFEPGEKNPLEPGPRTNFVNPLRRVEHIVALKPDVATLDLNTMNFGGEIVVNTPKSVKVMASAIYDSGVMPELEFFDSGDIALGRDLVADGTLKVPTLGCLVLGVKYGFTPSAETMLYAEVAAASWNPLGRIRNWARGISNAGAVLHSGRQRPDRHGRHGLYRKRKIDIGQRRTRRKGGAHS